MNKQPVRKSRENRSQTGTIAIRRSPVCSDPGAAGIALRPRLPARIYALFLQGIEQLGGRLLKQRRRRKMQLLDMQQLGEKRFVAIVQVGKQKFLIGGAATSVSLLAEIDAHRATVIAPRPLGQESA
jgi:flagellar biosynthesis protein FliO